MEQNRQALTDLGLWGVPSFRVRETYFWGVGQTMVAESRAIKIRLMPRLRLSSHQNCC